MCETVLAMAKKQQRLDLKFFIPISKEERLINAEKDFETLHERLEEEHALSKVVFKRPVGRPKKELKAMLLKPKVEPMKKTTKKVRGPYTNWFTPTLWPPIFAAMKQFRSAQGAVDYLRAAWRFK